MCESSAPRTGTTFTRSSVRLGGFLVLSLGFLPATTAGQTTSNQSDRFAEARAFILETIAEVGEFDDKSGVGIAFQIDVEDALGVRHQIAELTHVVEEEL
jgi:hypothetical protein